MTNPDLIELAMRMVQRASTLAVASNPPTPAATDQALEMPQPAPQEPIEAEKPPTPPTLASAPANVGLTRTTPAKERRAADELAAMILDDLSKIQGCPRRGIKVAVYGSNPWNSWLSFGADAGPVPNKAELQEFCELITERLKRLYDV